MSYYVLVCECIFMRRCCVDSLHSLSDLQLVVVLQNRCSPVVLQTKPSCDEALLFLDVAVQLHAWPCLCKPTSCLVAYSRVLAALVLFYGGCAMAGVCILVGCASCLLHKRSVLHLSRLFVFVPALHMHAGIA